MKGLPGRSKNHHSPEQDHCMRHLKVETELLLEKKEILEG